MRDEARCSKCQAHIKWCATVNRKMQPIDAEPNEAGNLRLIDEYVQTERGVLQRVLVAKADAPALDDDGIRYMPHHATCKFAGEFPKGKRATRAGAPGPR